MRATVAVAAAALVLAGACGGSSAAPDVPSATVGTAAPQTTTTNPFAVPATIDAAYVNRILAELDVAVGDVVRMVVETKFIPREAYDRLRAVYGTDAALQVKIDGFQADIRRGLSGYRLPTPGNKRTQVVNILSASPSCVYASVHRDFSAVSPSPLAELSSQWVALRPLEPARDPHGYNKVGWAFVYDGFEPGVRAPAADPCAAG